MSRTSLHRISRRHFIHGTAAIAATSPWWATALSAADTTVPHRPIYKTLKIGMVNVPGSLTDKFKAVKAAGFDGIEMDSPGMDVDETRNGDRGIGPAGRWHRLLDSLVDSSYECRRR